MKKIAIFTAIVAVLVSFAFFYGNSVANTAVISNIQPSGTGVAKTGLTFSWNAVLGASYYNVKVDDNPAFSSPELQRTNLSSTSFQQGTQIGDLDPLAGLTTYNIEVRAFDSGNKQIDMGTEDFETQK